MNNINKNSIYIYISIYLKISPPAMLEGIYILIKDRYVPASLGYRPPVGGLSYIDIYNFNKYI